MTKVVDFRGGSSAVTHDDDDYLLRLQAAHLAGQLPPNRGDALKVVGWLLRIVRDHLLR